MMRAPLPIPSPLLSFFVLATVSACAATPSKTNAPTAAPAASAPSYAKAPAAKSAGSIALCPMQISNPPPVGANGKVAGGPLIAINGVKLLLQPATNVCLSSGYGQRNGKTHRGVDYHTRAEGDVLAAGDGTILEAMARADFGNMIVIDHGGGVYTRYAHLASFSKSVAVGASVKMGTKLGPIGATGATTVKHLHFEILSGKYVAGVGTFGLASHDPFALPAAKSASAHSEKCDAVFGTNARQNKMPDHVDRLAFCKTWSSAASNERRGA